MRRLKLVIVLHVVSDEKHGLKTYDFGGRSRKTHEANLLSIWNGMVTPFSAAQKARKMIRFANLQSLRRKINQRGFDLIAKLHLNSPQPAVKEAMPLPTSWCWRTSPLTIGRIDNFFFAKKTVRLSSYTLQLGKGQRKPMSAKWTTMRGRARAKRQN